VTNATTGEVIVHNSLNQMSKALGFRRNSVSSHMERFPRTAYRGYFFKWIARKAEHKAIDGIKRTVVKTVNLATGEERLYKKTTDLLKKFHMSSSTLYAILNGKRSNEYNGYRITKA